MLAAVDFMRKPSIASRPKESIDEYLRRNGVEDDVIAVARDVADGKRDAAGVVFEEETPAAPEAPAATGGTAHAPTFDFASSAAALAEIDAIWAETEKLISCDDLASLLNKLEHTKKKTLKRAMRDRITARANDVATQLQSEGWAVLDDFCAPDLVTRVLQDIAPVEPFYEASEIWVGADSTVGAQVSVPSVRGDRVLWMCGAHPRPAASADFTRNVDERGGVEPCEARVKDGLNKAKGGAARLSKSQVAKFAGVRDLFKALDAFVLGELVPRVDVLNDVTSRSDGMLAIYPGDGARFQAHVDNTTADGRRLTVLCYFNTDWAPDAGGALRVHPPSGPRDIARTHAPKAGRVAIFYSKTMKHEVRPNRAHRTSVTLWYYSDGERREAVERSKEDAGANRVASSATDAERLAAQKFAKELCAPDAPRPDALAIADLAARAAALPAAAQHILAGMAGVPETHFAAALRRLEPDDLVKLRNRFANMGV